MEINEHVNELIVKLNNTYHRGIKRTPNEAQAILNDSSLLKAKNEYNQYAKEFNRTAREQFKKDDIVLVQISEAKAQKKPNPKYEEKETIVEELGNDSYNVLVNDKIYI